VSQEEHAIRQEVDAAALRRSEVATRQMRVERYAAPRRTPPLCLRFKSELTATATRTVLTRSLPRKLKPCFRNGYKRTTLLSRHRSGNSLTLGCVALVRLGVFHQDFLRWFPEEPGPSKPGTWNFGFP
jgi:hypothetical protein